MLYYTYIVHVLILVLFIKSFDAVTVKPICRPSNKIAPHRRIQNLNYNRGRTFGHFFEFFGEDGGEGGSNLVEQPDEGDDCGDIDDYDENDLSAITGNANFRRDSDDSRLFFNWFNGGNSPPKPQRPEGNPLVAQPPQVPIKPVRPTRPPYSSGGVFANNPYRPPLQQNPSDSLKPVHETQNDPQANYQPSIVGGHLPHVVGVPVRPIRPMATYQPNRPTATYQANLPTATYEQNRPNNNYYQSTADRTQRPQKNYAPVTRRPKARRFNNDSSVIGSFFDLLFK